MNRRNFMKLSVLGSAALLVNTKLLAESGVAGANESFKAIVRLNLGGGHDSLNMLIPYEDSAYADYQRIRSLLAIPKEDLIPLIFDGQPSGYALHPKLPLLAELFNSGELAFVSNVGPLVEPITKAQVENNQAQLPPHLFSHNSQTDQWSSCISDPGIYKTGWAGRLAENYLHNDAQFVIGQSIGSKSLWQKGITQQPYVFGVNGAANFIGFTTKQSQSTKAMVEGMNALDAHSYSPLIRQFNRMNSDAIYNSAYVNSVLSEPSLDFDPLDFDSTSLGEQGDVMQKFEMLSKVIIAKDSFSTRRATYSIDMGGYDTHSGQASSIDRLYKALDASIYAFYQKMKQHGLENSITLFCSSEFGRTVSTNESGTDHGWGGHYFVLGGDVVGGQVYGKQPDLKPDSKDIVFKARLLPAISVDQYAATMTSWLGVTEEQNLELFSNLKNFEEKNLGFMKG
jgi:uncharacterized protein (DUF1501 family)